MVGQPLTRLLHGDAALAFDGGGRLVLEARSYRSILELGSATSAPEQDADADAG
jgi:hypothetical protein